MFKRIFFIYVFLFFIYLLFSSDSIWACVPCELLQVETWQETQYGEDCDVAWAACYAHCEHKKTIWEAGHYSFDPFPGCSCFQSAEYVRYVHSAEIRASYDNHDFVCGTKVTTYDGYQRTCGLGEGLPASEWTETFRLGSSVPPCDTFTCGSEIDCDSDDPAFECSDEQYTKPVLEHTTCASLDPHLLDWFFRPVYC